MNYRAYIDGLRAIAVLAVFIYHLGAKWLPGGYIGVDIFFVISGFLITGIIRKSAINHTFSFSEFFLRRVRRIAPALLFMTLCVVIAGFLLLKPSELVSLYQSAWTQPFALQNMHFLIEGEYFNGSDRKPLLHTWSLGVEEQFYLVWPLLILLVSRFSKNWILITVISVMLASFTINILLLSISPKASFFLFPARAWEMAAGGLLAILLENRSIDKTTAWLRAAVASTGLCLMGVGFFTITSDVPYPGYYALLPVVGTLCLIWGSDQTPIGAILSSRTIVKIGLISYSLYLWHWPIIVFARVQDYDLSNPVTIVSIIVCAFFLASYSHKLIEEPFRKRKLFNSEKSLTTSFCAATLALAITSVVAIKTQGFSFRYSDPARSMLTASFNTDGDGRCGFLFRVMNPKGVMCHTNKVVVDAGQGVLLWGNSHAAMWVGVINELGNAFDRPIYLSARNCRPTADSSFCGKSLQQNVLRSIEDKSISDVILASSWYGAYDIDDPVFESEMKAIVSKLVEMDRNVWLVVDTPSGDKFDPIAQYNISPDSPEIGVYPYEFFEEKFKRERAFFSDLSHASSKVNILDPSVGICPNKIQCLGGMGNSVWYRDGGHLTKEGAATGYEIFKAAFSSEQK